MNDLSEGLPLLDPELESYLALVSDLEESEGELRRVAERLGGRKADWAPSREAAGSLRVLSALNGCAHHASVIEARVRAIADACRRAAGSGRVA